MDTYKVKVPKSLVNLFKKLSEEVPVEVIVYFDIDVDHNKKEVLVKPVYCFPTQRSTYAEVEPIRCDDSYPFDGVAHLHPPGVYSFSLTDWHHLNPYNTISILFVRPSIKISDCVVKCLKDEKWSYCGCDIEIYDDGEEGEEAIKEILKDFKKKIITGERREKTKKFPYII